MKIDKVLEKLYSKYKIEEKIITKDVEVLWVEMMGDYIKNYTESVNLNKGVLWIKLSSPALKNELQFAKEKIKKELNENLGKQVIETVNIF